MPLVRKCKNVYFTIEKMLDYMQIEEIYELAGCDKLLFGSEFPELPHAGALGLAMYADIPAEEREKILYKNWEDIRYDHS
jgi:predicted TIM-barrel fold metal-dependent hydrolase